MSDFRAIREEIESLMDLLEGYQGSDEDEEIYEDDEEVDDLDEDEDVEDEDLEEQYRRAKKRTIFAGGGSTGRMVKTGRATGAMELRKAARAARKYRKRQGRSSYRKSLRRMKRLRKQPKFQRIQRRKRLAAIKKGTRQESAEVLDRLADLLEGLEEATGYEFGIENGELYYYEDDE